jgi:hypothetical protein
MMIEYDSLYSFSPNEGIPDQPGCGIDVIGNKLPLYIRSFSFDIDRSL